MAPNDVDGNERVDQASKPSSRLQCGARLNRGCCHSPTRLYLDTDKRTINTAKLSSKQNSFYYFSMSFLKKQSLEILLTSPSSVYQI